MNRNLLALFVGLATFVTALPAMSAVSFTGSYSSNLKQSNGTTNIPTGTRYIIVVDSGTAGFGASVNGSIAAGASLTVGSLFGGDEIIQSSVVGALAGRATTDISNMGLDLAPYAGKQFALIWFSTQTGTTTVDGDSYGFYRDAGWILPNAAGTYGFASSGGDYVQNVANLTASNTVGAIPEPSRMMLLAFGALGLFVRRRR